MINKLFFIGYKQRIFTFLLALMMATAATAIEPEDVLYYRVGNVSLRPNFGIAQSYNDNVYFRGDSPIFLTNPDGSVRRIDREDDFITSLSGGTSILLGTPTGNFFGGGYTYSHRLFQEHTLQNAGGHNISLQGQLEGARISLTPSIRFRNSESILSGAAGSSIALREQLVERNMVQSSVSTRIRLSSKSFTTSSVNYRLNDIIGTLPLFDSDDVNFQQGFGFQFRPRIDLSATGSFGRRSTTPNSTANSTSADQNYFGGGFRAEGEFSDRLVGEVSFGLQHSTFGGTSESFTAPVVGISLEYLMGRDISADISYTRQTFVGIQSANESGVRDQVGLTIRKPLGIRKNWIVSATGNLNHQSWENQTGPSGDRSDDWISGNFAIQYQIQEWLSSSFTYSLQSFSSSLSRAGTFGIVDYSVNTVSLSLSVGY